MILLFALATLVASQASPVLESSIDLLGVDQTGKLLLWHPMIAAPNDGRLSSTKIKSERESLYSDMKSSWKVNRGELTATGDGCGIETMFVVRNHIWETKWRVSSGSEVVLYLRGTPSIRLRDSRNRIDASFGLGSGGLFLNKHYRAHPMVFADKPVSEWNDLKVIEKEDRVTVVLNGINVVDSVPLEPFWRRTKPLPIEGSLGLGSVRGMAQFRSMRVMPLSD